MKKSWVQLVIVGILGIAIGRMFPAARGNAADPAAAAAIPEVRRSTKAAQRAESGRSASLEKLRREASRTQPDQVPALVFRVLEIPDPLQRRAALIEVLKYADASNGVAIVAGFAKITRETGRTHPQEWKDALVEIGRRGGADLLDQWKAKGSDGSSEELWSGIYGMALDDPAAAMAWLQSSGNQDLADRGRLTAAVIGGATLSNADEGMRMMAALPLSERKDCIGHFTWNLIQNGGLDSALDWMLSVKKSSAATEPDYAAAVEGEVFTRILEAAKSTGGTAEMADSLAKINAADPISTSRLLNTIGPLRGTEGLDVIDRLARTPAMANSDTLDQSLQIITLNGSQKSPQAIQQWLEQHPSSPIADRVRAFLATPPSN